MPTEAIKIPQNVQIEDKVVGPLSLRQITIMALGGGFSYMIYAATQKSMGVVPVPLTIVIWIPAVIAAAFAVVNINDLSLTRILFLFIERIMKPGRRTWAPRSGISITIRTSAVKEEKPADVSKTQKMSTQQQIAQLSTVVDQASPVPAAVDAVAAEAATVELPTITTPAPTVSEPAPEALPRLPVQPDRIQVDVPHPTAKAKLSDLSVFRDIFPPSTTWQS